MHEVTAHLQHKDATGYSQEIIAQMVTTVPSPPSSPLFFLNTNTLSAMKILPCFYPYVQFFFRGTQDEFLPICAFIIRS